MTRTEAVLILMAIIQVGILLMGGNIMHEMVKNNLLLAEKMAVQPVTILRIDTPSVQIDGMWEQLTATRKDLK